MIEIPKIEGTLKFEQYQTISIINHIAMIFLKVMTERIRNKIRPEIAEEQFAFVANSGTTNALFTYNRITENQQKHKKMYMSALSIMKGL